LKAPARVHWGVNDWQDIRDIDTSDTGLGLEIADLPVTHLTSGQTIRFTFQWRDSGAWEGRDYEVQITD
jgi:glucoamylase